MIQYKCAKCGSGELEPLGDGTAMCVYCQSIMVLPTVGPEDYNRANQLRVDRKFDLARAAFEKIVSENPTDPEAYWNLVLCKYGIEYVLDTDGITRVPTCNRMTMSSVLEDPDYLKALKYADGLNYSLYESEAKQIDTLMQRIQQVARAQKPYDVFISYKETDENGHTTADANIAQDVYDVLKEKHPELNIFLSRISLKQDAAGYGYEPVIYSALRSAKLMILVGTSRENLESTWVSNEWSRYLTMMETDPRKQFVVVYRDMNPGKDLPAELGLAYKQAVLAAGYWQPDFVKSMENLLNIRKKTATQVTGNINTLQANNLCKRAEQNIEVGQWLKAREYLNKALDYDAENVKAWYDLFLVATQNLTEKQNVALDPTEQQYYEYYERAMRYATSEDKAELGPEGPDYVDAAINAYEAYRNRVEAESRQKEAADAFKQIIDKTKNGMRFEEYGTYGPDSKLAARIREIGTSEQKERLERFLSQYKNSYEKYKDFKQKGEGIVQTICSDSQYRKLLDSKAKLSDKANRKGAKVSEFSTASAMIFPALLTGVVAILSHVSKIAGTLNLDIICAIMAVVISFGLFFILAGITSHLSGGMWFIWGVLGSFAAYIGLEYMAYRIALPLQPGLTAGCMFNGLLRVFIFVIALSVIIIIGAVLISVGLVPAVIVGVILIVGVNFLDKILPDVDTLSRINDGISDMIITRNWLYLVIAGAAITVLCLLIGMRESAKRTAYQRAKYRSEDITKELKSFYDNRFDEEMKTYKNWIDASYIEALKKTNTAVYEPAGGK